MNQTNTSSKIRPSIALLLAIFAIAIITGSGVYVAHTITAKLARTHAVSAKRIELQKQVNALQKGEPQYGYGLGTCTDSWQRISTNALTFIVIFFIAISALLIVISSFIAVSNRKPLFFLRLFYHAHLVMFFANFIPFMATWFLINESMQDCLIEIISKDDQRLFFIFMGFVIYNFIAILVSARNLSAEIKHLKTRTSDLGDGQSRSSKHTVTFITAVIAVAVATGLIIWRLQLPNFKEKEHRALQQVIQEFEPQIKNLKKQLR